MPGLDSVAARAWIAETAREIDANADALTKLDAAIGDGDHGVNMRRGMKAVTEALADAEENTPPDQLMILVGRTLVSKVGGASGPLWGQFFKSIGRALKDAGPIGGPELAAAITAGVEGVQELGQAHPGDKTMVDALSPAAAALSAAIAADETLPDALSRAYAAAEEGAKTTIGIQARKGRASYLGERAIGHQDPGSASAVLVIGALAHALR